MTLESNDSTLPRFLLSRIVLLVEEAEPVAGRLGDARGSPYRSITPIIDIIVASHPRHQQNSPSVASRDRPYF